MTLQPATILVVDDDAMVRNIAATAFEAFGCRVLEAGDGASALAQVAAHPEIALLFTDRDLPGVGGRELAAAAQALRPDLKVVLTADVSAEAALPSGLPFVPRPWRIATLKALVQSPSPQTTGQAGAG